MLYWLPCKFILTSAGIAILVATHFPDNHLGMDVRMGYILPIFTIALALATLFRSQCLVKAAIAGSVLFLLLLAFVDFGNILVGYEEWCHRAY